MIIIKMEFISREVIMLSVNLNRREKSEKNNIEEEVQVASEQKRRTVYLPCNCKAIECFSKIPEHDRLIINRSYWEKTNTQRKQWVYDHITRSSPKQMYSETGTSKRQYTHVYSLPVPSKHAGEKINVCKDML